MRSLLAIILGPVLLLALQQAPFLHLHENGVAPEHVAAAHPHEIGAHSHLSGRLNRSHAGNDFTLDASDEIAIAIGISLFHSDAAKAPLQFLALRTFVAADAPTWSDVRFPRERPRNHAPPLDSSLSPRAPPA